MWLEDSGRLEAAPELRTPHCLCRADATVLWSRNAGVVTSCEMFGSGPPKLLAANVKDFCSGRRLEHMANAAENDATAHGSSGGGIKPFHGQASWRCAEVYCY